MSSKGPHMLVPALLTHTSIPPKVEAAVLASSRVWAGSVTSVGTASARTPSASQSRAACSSSSRCRAARTTLAPRRAKAWAVASPMPLEAPVITTTESLRFLSTRASSEGQLVSGMYTHILIGSSLRPEEPTDCWFTLLVVSYKPSSAAHRAYTSDRTGIRVLYQVTVHTTVRQGKT